MASIDVFNGDADGICSLLQLRLTRPEKSILITGIKRDIQLLKQVQPVPGDNITVLDISLDKNRPDLIRILEQQVTVFYVDHHFAGEIPEHQNLKTLIDTDANTCTSLLINQHLSGQHYPWAICGAYGDNLKSSAEKLVIQSGLSPNHAKQLEELGILINYNGYGADISDLHFPPEQLFKHLLAYPRPLDFIADPQSVFSQLQAGYQEDNLNIRSISPEYETEKVALFILPDAAWARRVSGIFSNELANKNPHRAHAVLSHNQQGGYLISVRAPLTNKTGADELCRQFATGGGRKAAAGINHLPVTELAQFIECFNRQFRENQ